MVSCGVTEGDCNTFYVSVLVLPNQWCHLFHIICVLVIAVGPVDTKGFFSAFLFIRQFHCNRLPLKVETFENGVL